MYSADTRMSSGWAVDSEMQFFACRRNFIFQQIETTALLVFHPYVEQIAKIL
jgi:hypothetical protein